MRFPMATRSTPLLWALRVLVAAGLVVDAVVHLRLASLYQFAYPAGIGGGNLFRIEAVAAVVAAIAVLVWASRWTSLFAFAVAASAFAAVVLSVYVELPAIGPIPSMYEPLWFGEKTLSAVAEGVAAVAALAGFVTVARTSATSRHSRVASTRLSR